MRKENINIEIASIQDAEEILDIYAPYVLNTAITFEYTIPGILEFKERIKKTLQRYPYIVAKNNDEEIVGYAYTGVFKGRAAYDWSVETTVYVKQSGKKLGIGRRLYEALEKISYVQHVTNMNACIAVPREEDKYLTRNSIQFHEHMGYNLVGEFHKCAYKFDNWYNMVWMEKVINIHADKPEPFIPFSQLSNM